MSAAAKKLPSAEARTISLFTGVEVWRPERAPRWSGNSLGYGDPDKPTYREVARIASTHTSFEARVCGELVGTAETLTGAVSLCMTALARREAGRE